MVGQKLDKSVATDKEVGDLSKKGSWAIVKYIKPQWWRKKIDKYSPGS
jgi:hypothetical protein